jgi:hypothetical protein
MAVRTELPPSPRPLRVARAGRKRRQMDVAADSLAAATEDGRGSEVRSQEALRLTFEHGRQVGLTYFTHRGGFEGDRETVGW